MIKWINAFALKQRTSKDDSYDSMCCVCCPVLHLQPCDLLREGVLSNANSY